MDNLNALTMRQLQHLLHMCARAPAARARAAADAQRRLPAAAAQGPPLGLLAGPADSRGLTPATSAEQPGGEASSPALPGVPAAASPAAAAPATAQQRPASAAGAGAAAASASARPPAMAPGSFSDRSPLQPSKGQRLAPGALPEADMPGALPPHLAAQPAPSEVAADEAAVLAALAAPLHWPCLSIGGGAMCLWLLLLHGLSDCRRGTTPGRCRRSTSGPTGS